MKPRYSVEKVYSERLAQDVQDFENAQADLRADQEIFDLGFILENR